MNPFHLAFPVIDLDKTKAFYLNVLGCTLGRESDRWVDFNFYGHQISAHLKPEACEVYSEDETNAVDGDQVPVRHFGLVLGLDEWFEFEARLKKQSVRFLISPKVRFEGQPGEQRTLFLKDPSNNAIEIKGFRSQAEIFQT